MSIKLKLLGIVLFPFVVIYTFLVYLRNRFYDWGLFNAKEIDAPVMSVGNIQLGGTGKTPFVEYLAKQLIAMGYQAAVLTRGYKRLGRDTVIIEDQNRDDISPAIVGDEPFLLSQNVRGLIIGVDKNRFRAANKIRIKYPNVIFLMDDGFQHRPLKRDLDIVLIDVTRWSSTSFLFPLSNLRDVKSSLKRAHLFVLTRLEGSEKKAKEIKGGLLNRFDGDIIDAEVQPKSLISVKGQEISEVKSIKDKKIAAFCGLANPMQFFSLLSHLAGDLCFTKTFGDHYSYQSPDIQDLQNKANKLGVDYVITTQKDAVKMRGIEGVLLNNIFYLEMDLKVNNEKILSAHLEKVLSSNT